MQRKPLNIDYFNYKSIDLLNTYQYMFYVIAVLVSIARHICFISGYKMNNEPGTSLIVAENTDQEVPSTLIDAVRTLVPAQVFFDEAEVRKELPGVLGKILALCWINQSLANYFLFYTKNFLDRIDIYLPENIVIEVNKDVKAKTSITVFQAHEGKKFKQRLFKLSLKLIANR